MPAILSLKSLLIEQLNDLYEAEIQQLRFLPRLYKHLKMFELKNILNQYLIKTQMHVQRLDRVFLNLRQVPVKSDCRAMRTLLREAIILREKCTHTEVLEVATISALQKIVHYEISGYGAVCSYASQLNTLELAALLHDTLLEVKEMDRQLAQVAANQVYKLATSEFVTAEVPETLAVQYGAY